MSKVKNLNSFRKFDFYFDISKVLPIPVFIILDQVIMLTYNGFIVPTHDKDIDYMLSILYEMYLSIIISYFSESCEINRHLTNKD